MTLEEALCKGYEVVEIRRSLGYVSRLKTYGDCLFEELKWAPRKNMYYFEVPCFDTTRYHYRYYIR